MKVQSPMLQLDSLFPVFDLLHEQHGDSSLSPIYGAGQIKNPRIMLVFMNPTARNISANLEWQGIRAPWLGTKHVWKMLWSLGMFLDSELLGQTQEFTPTEWTPQFSETLYSHLSDHSIYITNIAKCTQCDARPLSNSLFKEYVPSILDEIENINPQNIITFGNQVSSVLLGKPISVSDYTDKDFEELITTKRNYKVYPTYYPVGQGIRNMSKAIERINTIIG